MASNNEHKPTLIMNHTSPIYEYERDEGEDLDDYHQDHDASSSSSPCGVGGCFGLFGFTSCTWRQNHDNDYERKYLLQQEGGSHKETTWWWRKKLNKAKESTRVLDGSKWKTFIRKIAGYCKTTKQKQNNREGNDAAVDFAARFAAPLSNEHGSIGRPVHKTTLESASIESKR
ncbi:PREDICTED: uncharacterized protein LOC103341367 [Prunus mume]|uniref:Uncharacterized protein LOC103341367 n=1 Tax=Prunus mume TaxID=102107 RepID=A0ABM0PQU8_PRUMU|nr:PREDICTED: uncharacterized protein LOC103341367 [Prunus mume]